MPTKIRLQRKGKKGQPFYHLVVADGRAPRDGKFIEKLGTYNPMTHPATIDINFDRALYWVQVGAQPTDTARSILSNKGVFLKHHLIKGVAKGALTEAQVEERFQEWLADKQQKLDRMSSEHHLSEKESDKERLEAERKINQAKAEALAKKRTKETLKAEKAAEPEAEETEQVTEASETVEAKAETAPEQEAATAPEETEKTEEAAAPEETEKKEEAPEDTEKKAE